MIYQSAAEARDRRRFPPPGRLVDVGGRRLHLTEDGTGSPAVVIMPALGGNVLEWMHVQRELAPEIRVCVADRAGIGWSDLPPRGRRTVDSMADELHQSLTGGGIEPPYVIGGHSFGGIVARRFAARYPNAVVGMVLVELQPRGPGAAARHEEGARQPSVEGGPAPVADPGPAAGRRQRGALSAALMMPLLPANSQRNAPALPARSTCHRASGERSSANCS